MFDDVGSVVMPDIDSNRCPACSTLFHPKRKNQRYCSRSCQRKSSRNVARGDRSAEYKERNRQHYERAARLAEMIYTTPLHERLGVMKYILEFIPNDAGLRNILTDQKLHKEPPRKDNRKNIAKAANAYTRKFFGLSIGKYIKIVMAGNEPQGIPVSH